MGPTCPSEIPGSPGEVHLNPCAVGAKFSFNYFLYIAFVREISPKLSRGFGCYRHEWINPYAAGAHWPIQNDAKNLEKKTETLANGYSSESRDSKGYPMNTNMKGLRWFSKRVK